MLGEPAEVGSPLADSPASVQSLRDTREHSAGLQSPARSPLCCAPTARIPLARLLPRVGPVSPLRSAQAPLPLTCSSSCSFFDHARTLAAPLRAMSIPFLRLPAAPSSSSSRSSTPTPPEPAAVGRLRKGAQLSSAYIELSDPFAPVRPFQEFEETDSPSAVQDYVAALVRRDPHDVEEVIQITLGRDDDGEEYPLVDEGVWVYEQLRYVFLPAAPLVYLTLLDAASAAASRSTNTRGSPPSSRSAPRSPARP